MISARMNRATRTQRVIAIAAIVVGLFDVVWGGGSGCDCEAQRQRMAISETHSP